MPTWGGWLMLVMGMVLGWVLKKALADDPEPEKQWEPLIVALPEPKPVPVDRVAEGEQIAATEFDHLMRHFMAMSMSTLQGHTYLRRRADADVDDDFLWVMESAAMVFGLESALADATDDQRFYEYIGELVTDMHKYLHGISVEIAISLRTPAPATA